MTSVKPREEIKLLFDDLRTAKNLAIHDVLSVSKKWESEVTYLKDKISSRELLFDTVLKEVETTQLGIKSKKNTNVTEKQNIAVAKRIALFKESAEKLETEAANLTAEYEHWQEEREKKVKEMKEIWDAHCQAMHRYKKKLNIYIDINDENGKIFTIYFFQTDKESGNEYTVKLQQKEDRWEMISMNPHLPQERKLQKHLSQSNDIQGFLVCVRNLFKYHRDSKH